MRTSLRFGGSASGMLKQIGLLIASVAAFLPRVAFPQHDPIQIIVNVSEVTIVPQTGDDPGMEAIDAEGQVVNLPFTQRTSSPIRAEFSVVPGVLHKQRIIAGRADLYLELTLTPPADDSTTAKAKFFYHKQNQPAASHGALNLHTITEPFANEATLVIPFTGSSVELGKRMERFGKTPKQTVVSTHILLSVLPPNAGARTK